jgi:hypothetical protein
MSKSHNKKRNVGIIYELLLRYISNNLINDDKKSAQSALRILEKRFHKSTEIYREFRLFNALAKSTVSDSAVAAAILTEAKGAARRADKGALNKEKSLLIRDINHILNDSSFYYRRVPEYKTYATIQSLLNDWRKLDEADLLKMVELEGKMVEWLLSEKTDESLDENIDPNVDTLVVRIMTEKINSKYKNKLNEDQRNIIKSYVFSLSSDNGKSISQKLDNMREDTVNQLYKFKKMTDNKYILEKIDRVENSILEVSIDNVDDAVISKFLVISQLQNEIKEAINELR